MAAASTFLLTVAGLAILWWTINTGLDLYLLLMDRWTQASRDDLALERIHENAYARQRSLEAARQRRQGWSVVDIDGQRRWLERSQLAAFVQACQLELGLVGSCSWGELRRHWRRSSLRWHPDQGGDPAVWLRKLRAYEALSQLSRDPSARARGGTTSPAALFSPRIKGLRGLWGRQGRRR